MSDKITNILVAIDFSEPSLNALHTAIALAAKQAASLYLLHVHEILPHYSDSHVKNTEIPSKSDNVLTALAADVFGRTKTKPVIIKEKGHVTTTIIQSAIQHKCDLIVMGSYGASGYRTGFVGTNAYSVVKLACCPVLLIPSGRKWTFFKNPLLPIRPVITGLRHYEIINNFTIPGYILQILGLTPAGSNTISNELIKVVEEMKTKLGIDNIEVKTRQNHETNISDHVLSQAEINNADLLIVTPAIDFSTKQCYIGPNAHRIIHNSRIPLLNINKQLD